MIRATGLAKRYGDESACSRAWISSCRAAGFFVVTGPERLRQDDALAALRRARGADLRASWRWTADRAAIGFLGHEPLVYKELTALENLDLYGRLYAIPERRERIGMLLERFGLWDVRSELVSTFSRGMSAAARALQVPATRPRSCSFSTSRTARSTRRAPICSTASSAELRATSTCLVATHDPERLAALTSGSLALA